MNSAIRIIGRRVATIVVITLAHAAVIDWTVLSIG